MRSQAYRPAPWWLPLIGLIAYAIVAAGVVYLALVLLTSLAQYVPVAGPAVTLPDFLQYRDRDWSTQRDWMQRAYAATREQPLMLNTGYGEEPFTIEVALEWAERLADEWLA